jgi:DNA-binding CsgD family transcriptional regulator
VAADALSEREVEVLRCVARGAANKEVATRLHISEETVKVHMKHILEKLAATDRTHAVTIALSRGNPPGLQHGLQSGQFDRLGQVCVEPGLPRAPAILCLTITAYRHEPQTGEGELPDTARELVAVHSR